MKKLFLLVVPIMMSVACATSDARTTPNVHATRGGLAVPSYLAPIIREAAAKYDVQPELIAAVTYQESRFDPRAVSSRGAQGLMQLMPRTARAMGVNDAFDPRENVFGGTKYLRLMLDEFDGDLELALAAYNAGPMAVKKRGVAATQEAVHYVAAVKRFYAAARA